MIEGKIRIRDIEEINTQANALAGLTHVISMYFVNMKEDELLQNVFSHLHEVAFKHKKDCNKFIDNYDIIE